MDRTLSMLVVGSGFWSCCFLPPAQVSIVGTNGSCRAKEKNSPASVSSVALVLCVWMQRLFPTGGRKFSLAVADLFEPQTHHTSPQRIFCESRFSRSTKRHTKRSIVASATHVCMGMEYYRVGHCSSRSNLEGSPSEQLRRH